MAFANLLLVYLLLIFGKPAALANTLAPEVVSNIIPNSQLNNAYTKTPKLGGHSNQFHDGDNQKDEDAPPAETKDEPKDPEEEKKQEKEEPKEQKKEEEDKPEPKEKTSIEKMNDIVDIEFTSGYNIVYLILILILCIVTIDLWCCVSVAQLKNEPYYIYDTNDQRQLEQKKDVVRKQLQN